MASPVPYTVLDEATEGFTRKLGAGATGEVFSGTLRGLPVAVKRLRLTSAAPEGRAELERRFRAELHTLSAYAHPRIVRLLHYCISEEPQTQHPFLLCFELLECGSLADALAAAPALSALERLDVALGVAHGLAFLHGMRDPGEAAAGAAALHRDVKSANIGLTRAGSDAAGPRYAKLLDCGLAKAVKGGAAGGAGGGTSVSEGGLVGTLGYIAPEVGSSGVYTVASEVYSFGVVLLELLQGRVVEVTTLAQARDECEDAAWATAPLEARADAAWPPALLPPLAALILDCTAPRQGRRPAGMAPILQRLRALRLACAPPDAPPLVDCGVCMEECEEARIVRCSPPAGAPGHACCLTCLAAHVKTHATPQHLERYEGAVPCVSHGCAARPWTLKELQERGSLDAATLLAFTAGLRRMLFDARRAVREAEERQARARAAAAHAAAVADKVRLLRGLIVERDLVLRCPRCRWAFDVNFTGCNALPCPQCGCGFCALCLLDCGADAHSHLQAVHGGYWAREDFTRLHRERRQGLVVEALRALRGEGESEQVLRALLAELGKADLRDLGIKEADVAAAAGLAGGGGGGGGEEPDLPPWACPSCSYFNHHALQECEVCSSPRPQGCDAACAAFHPGRLCLVCGKAFGEHGGVGGSHECRGDGKRGSFPRGAQSRRPAAAGDE